MLQTPRKRVFAGERARTLRARHGLNQTELAARIGLSVSYLSQIESNDRPMTDAVLMAFARAFPDDWADTGADDTMALLAAVEAAVHATTTPDSEFPPDAMRRAVNQQPLLATHLVSLHAAYARSQEQLRSLDDALNSGSETPLPWEEVRDWFHASGNYIDAIDRRAEAIALELLDEAGPAAAITERLQRAHGVSIGSDLPADRPLRSFDVTSRTLSVDPSLPSESRLFLLAHQLMRLELAAPIHAVIDSARLRSEEAFQLLSVGLANYAAGALLMPYSQFRHAARASRHDIDALRLEFGVSFEQACHRLSTLQRPGATGIPFFFCRVDMAGNITKRHSATRLQFARFGGACPLWIVHEAVAIPDRVLVQLAETPDGVRYVSMAKGLVKPSGSFARPSRRYAVALGCEVDYAQDFIYGDQLDVAGSRSVTPIGVSCRICPRRECEQRAFPPAGRNIHVNPDHRGVVPYTFD
ncbi:short-chain fatty acyl-CoA regulator family protein [Sphingomonas sp.]|uniref:helix-turn-helix domain-containing protein n=1 Tax=Sphingomonas sp. TaxID=28214 RepID=UPI0025E8AE7D|nr:helix-turn-helix transcriptional regulator [Sphingomonas sp.]